MGVIGRQPSPPSDPTGRVGGSYSILWEGVCLSAVWVYPGVFEISALLVVQSSRAGYSVRRRRPKHAVFSFRNMQRGCSPKKNKNLRFPTVWACLQIYPRHHSLPTCILRVMFINLLLLLLIVVRLLTLTPSSPSPLSLDISLTI